MASSNYGTTIAYYNMTPSMGLVSGVDAVADDILVRITTANLWYDPAYGIDVTLLVNSAQKNPSAVLGPVLQKIKQDPRVSTADGTVSFDDTTLALAVLVTLVGGETFTVVGKLGTVPNSALQFTYTVQPPQ